MNEQTLEYPDEMAKYFEQDPVIMGTNKALDMHYGKITDTLEQGFKDAAELDAFAAKFDKETGEIYGQPNNNQPMTKPRGNMAVLLPRTQQTQPAPIPRVYYRETTLIKDGRGKVFHHSFEIDTNDINLTQQTLSEVNKTKTVVYPGTESAIDADDSFAQVFQNKAVLTFGAVLLLMLASAFIH